jgi:NAD-dependent SIR2 family protein deacetylase
MSAYTIRYASGSTTTHADYQSATAEIHGSHSHAYCHECDGDERRTLVWACEDDSEGDDGSSAVAEIVEEA